MPANSLTRSFEKLAEKVGEPITPLVIASEIARLTATFGPIKDRSADQVRIMANEWLKALQGFGIKSLRYAIDNLIRNSKWWPALSEVYALCKADHDGWKDALLIDRQPSYKASDDGWVKPPPAAPLTEAEKIAKRAADVLAAREKYKDFFKSQSLTDRIDEWAPASKSADVSPALRNSCAAKRARGEPTCEPSCQRSSVGCAHAQQSAA